MLYHRIGDTDPVTVDVGEDISSFTSATVTLTDVFGNKVADYTGTISGTTVSFNPDISTPSIYEITITVTDGTNTEVFPKDKILFIAIW